MSTKKETAKKATEEKKKATAPAAEKETAKDPVKEETNQITDAGKKVDEPKQEQTESIVLPNDEQINELRNSYYEAVESYFNETGSLPEKGLRNHEIYDKIEEIKEQKEIAEMKRLEQIEANKPKTFAVTDGKQVINVTEATFKYLGKGWKKAPKVPKEVEQLKEEK